MKNNSSKKKRMIEMVFISVKTYITTPIFPFHTILSCDMKEKYLVYVIHVRFTKHLVYTPLINQRLRLSSAPKWLRKGIFMQILFNKMVQLLNKDQTALFNYPPSILKVTFHSIYLLRIL